MSAWGARVGGVHVERIREQRKGGEKVYGYLRATTSTVFQRAEPPCIPQGVNRYFQCFVFFSLQRSKGGWLHHEEHVYDAYLKRPFPFSNQL